MTANQTLSDMNGSWFTWFYFININTETTLPLKVINGHNAIAKLKHRSPVGGWARATRFVSLI